jgi:hypothetical protein
MWASGQLLLLGTEPGYSPASHRGCPGSSPGHVVCGLRWTKWHCGRFSPSTSVSPANSHSTGCSILAIVYHPGPSSGRRTKWTRSHPHPQEIQKTSGHRDRVVSCLGDPTFNPLPGDCQSRLKFRVFAAVPPRRCQPRPLPSTSFPIHYSLTILSFGAVQSMFITTPSVSRLVGWLVNRELERIWKGPVMT